MVESISEVLPGIVDVFMNLVTAVAEIAPAIIEALVNGIAENLPSLLEAAAQMIVSLRQACRRPANPHTDTGRSGHADLSDSH